ncbi:MAG: hypothetical protein HOV80_20765 [Polyangiaceae bacterium]|nr:hypothetical protein [Polyangiaceae bacterium]
MAWGGSHGFFLLLLAGAAAACSGEPSRDVEQTGQKALTEAPEPLDEGDVRATFSHTASEGFSLENRTLLAGFRATLSGASHARATERADGARYEDALGPGFDHEIERAHGGVRDRLSLPAAPRDGEVRYEIELGPAIAGLRVVGGGVELVTANGTVALRVNEASVEDANGVVRPIALRVEGCAFDEDPRPPWRRAPTPPGAARCDVVATLPDALAYPAVFDPLWTDAASMPEPRYDFEPVTMDNGTVLVVGGYRPGDHGRRVLAFDPVTLTWSTLGASANLARTCRYFALDKLQDGRLLFAGGFCDTMSGTQEMAEAFVFTPSTVSWTAVPNMTSVRGAPASALLTDGRVLVTGGQDAGQNALATTEIYNPSSNTWSPGAAMTEAREYHQAVDIGGRVLVAGGIPEGATSTETAEIYDPAGAGSWDPTIPFSQPRYAHTLTKLGDNKVVMVGGLASYMFVVSAIEVFDIPTETWSLHPTTYHFQDARAARGPGGGVLVTGGCDAWEDSVDCGNPTNQAIWFDPITTDVFPVDPMSTTRGRHGMATLADERIVAMGGKGGNSFGSIAVLHTQVYAPQVDGEPCTLPFQCASGFCVEGVCCDAACDGVCVSCLGAQTEAGTAGTCSPITGGTDPEDECLDEGAAACGLNGFCEAGACDTYDPDDCNASGCTDESECASGFCIDGVCCDVACEGLCQACSAAKKGTGTDGVCGPIARGTDPDGDCGPGNLPCEEANVCDGVSACASVLSLCSPFMCTSQGCVTVCTADLDCQDGAVCAGGACVPEESLCTNLTQALGRDGVTSDCSPYRCNVDGTCKLSCASVDDCAIGLVCDPDGMTCIAPPPAEGGEEGCACTEPGRGAPGGTAPIAALAIALAALARRRSRAA